MYKPQSENCFSEANNTDDVISDNDSEQSINMKSSSEEEEVPAKKVLKVKKNNVKGYKLKTKSK